MDTEVSARLMCGLSNYLPKCPHGEDDHSIMKHKEWLCDEWRSWTKRPDTAQLEKTILLTFPDSRDMVVNKNVSVRQLIEEFP